MSPSAASTRSDGPPRNRRQTQSALIDTAVALLTQLATLFSLIHNSGPHALAFESLLMPGATIGKHARHVLDHYRLLLDVVCDPAASGGLLCYDRRVRQTPIETSAQAALDAVKLLQARLAEFDRRPDEWLERKVTLEAVTPDEVRLETTCGREMWFVSLHAIHHLASIRVIAVGELDLDLPADFGLAPSTAVSRQAAAPSLGVRPGPKSPSKL